MQAFSRLGRRPYAAPSIATTFALGCVIGIASPSAQACGGFFCSTSPVDQNAERILFEVHPPPVGVTAVVEIAYTGDPGDFSWIVPVPETPTLDVVPRSTLRLLDAATAPIIMTPPTTCEEEFRVDDCLIFGCDYLTVASGEQVVAVEDLPAVGAFEPEVISSDDPAALVDWLNANNYLITPAMEPFIAQYVEQGYKFLGLKLTPDAGVNDIAPIKFSCPNGEMPLVPLRLTGVSAEPDMGIMVFVAGEQRYAPQNYRNLTVDTDMVQFDPRRQTGNYYPLVSWLLDQEGGKAFVTEFADTSARARRMTDFAPVFTADIEESREYLNGVYETFPYITRMYTRMSGWEMTDDPVFAPSDGGNVSRRHDLSDRPTVEVCTPDSFDPVACGNTYCGEGSQCATSMDNQDGCVCAPGTVARRITVPEGAGLPLRPSVVCQDRTLNVLADAEIADPCAGLSCGSAGECVAVNGFATCACDPGTVAVLDANLMQCAQVQRTYDAEQLLWVELPPGLAPTCACVTARSSTPVALGLGLLLGLGFLSGRRRRQR